MAQAYLIRGASSDDTATLSSLIDSRRTIENPDDDLRGRDVKDKDGQAVGRVDDLLIDDAQRMVRFLRVEHGGLLGFGETQSFVPVDAISLITGKEVVIDHSGLHVAGAPHYDPELVDKLPFYNSLYSYYGYLPFWNIGPSVRGIPTLEGAQNRR